MKLPKKLKIWVINFIVMGLLFPLPVFSNDNVEVEVINDRFIKIDGEIYGYAPKDKFVEMKKDLEKLPLKNRKINLLETKIKKKDQIIESKNEIIDQYKQHSKLMTKSFNRFSESSSNGVFDSKSVNTFVDIAIPITTFVIGAKFAIEATE